MPHCFSKGRLLVFVVSILAFAQSEHGAVTVPTPGTRVAFSNTRKKVNGLYVRAQAVNTMKVYIQGVNTITLGAKGVSLSAGDVFYADFADLSELFLDADVANEGVDYFNKGNNTN